MSDSNDRFGAFDSRSRHEERHRQAARQRKSMANPMSLQSILPHIEQQLGLPHKVQELSVFGLWKQVVPDSFAAAVQPKRLLKQQDGTYCLEVSTTHSTIANELQFASTAICEALNRYVPQTGCRVSRIKPVSR